MAETQEDVTHGDPEIGQEETTKGLGVSPFIYSQQKESSVLWISRKALAALTRINDTAVLIKCLEEVLSSFNK